MTVKIISVSLDENTLRLFDTVREDRPRGKFIGKLVDNYLKNTVGKK